MKEMVKVTKCDVTDCSYNKNNQCHTLAITVGGPEDPSPCCDTYIHSSQKGGIPDVQGGVGACKVENCSFNASLECSAPSVQVGRVQYLCGEGSRAGRLHDLRRMPRRERGVCRRGDGQKRCAGHPPGHRHGGRLSSLPLHCNLQILPGEPLWGEGRGGDAPDSGAVFRHAHPAWHLGGAGLEAAYRSDPVRCPNARPLRLGARPHRGDALRSRFQDRVHHFKQKGRSRWPPLFSFPYPSPPGL